MFESILVVCIGNICRSPMAERLLKHALPNKTISSAGLGALVGEGADPCAQQLLLAEGIDLSDHVARQLNADLVASHELILVMTERQKTGLESEYPSARGRVFRYCHWSGADVPDPYQLETAAFEHALTLIRQGTSDWAAKLG